jgi:hypothetical protein
MMRREITTVLPINKVSLSFVLQTFFCIFIDYRGHCRKGVAIFNADYVNFQPKPAKKCIFEHHREVQTIKNKLIYIDLVMKLFSDDLLRAALYRLMLVLHKDALFH